jgi:hypothetical protein
VRTAGEMVDPRQAPRQPDAFLYAYECNDLYEVGDQVVFVRPDQSRYDIDITRDTREARTETLVVLAALSPFTVPFLALLTGLRYAHGGAWFRMGRSVRLSWPFARPDVAAARNRWHSRYGHTEYLNAWDLWGLTRLFDEGDDVQRERADRRNARSRRKVRRGRNGRKGPGHRRDPNEKPAGAIQG